MNVNNYREIIMDCLKRRYRFIRTSVVAFLLVTALAGFTSADNHTARSLASYFSNEPQGTLVRRLEQGLGFSLALGRTPNGKVIERFIYRSESLKSDDGAKVERLVWTDSTTGLEVVLLRRRWMSSRDGNPNLVSAMPFVHYEMKITNRGKVVIKNIHSLHVGEWRFRPISYHERFHYEDLEYSTQTWYGSTFWKGPDWTRVGKDWHHSGQNVSSVRVFTVPFDGKVNIRGKIYKLDTKCGDGVKVAIRYYGITLWKAEIGHDDVNGVEPNITLNVREGDHIRFVLGKRGTIYCDTTHWDPTITYESGKTFRASDGFSNKQGAAFWSYQMEIEKPGADADLVLHFPRTNFEEHSEPIAVNKHVVLSGTYKDGSECQAMPFFILADGGDESGVVAALGRADAWQLRATRRKDGEARVELICGNGLSNESDAGIDLKPGETITFPPVIFGSYTGKWTSGTAALRRFLSKISEKSCGKKFAEIVQSYSRQVSAKLNMDAKRRMLSHANLFFPANILQCNISLLSFDHHWTSFDMYLHSLLASAYTTPEDARQLTSEATARIRATQNFHSKIRHLLTQNYYRPLPIPKDSASWDAQQFQSYESDEGVLLIFRQKSEVGEQTIRLLDLKPNAWYSIENAFGADAAARTGQALMNEGLRIALPFNGSQVLHYEIEGKAPPAPERLIVHSGGPHALELSWTPVRGANDYVIWRDGDVITRVENRTTYRDAGLVPNRTCRYAVAAERGFARSAPVEAFGTVAPAAEVYLCDLTSKDHDVQFGALAKSTFKIAGKEYKKGLGMISHGRASYELGSRYKKFTATVGIDDSRDDGAEAFFEVFGNGKLLLQTKPLSKGEDERISVNVSGVEELSITAAFSEERKREKDRPTSNQHKHLDAVKPSNSEELSVKEDGITHPLIWGDALLEPDTDVPKINSARPELGLWKLVEEDWRTQDKITESVDSYSRATAEALEQSRSLIANLRRAAASRMTRKNLDRFLLQESTELEHLTARYAALSLLRNKAGLDVWRSLYLQGRWLKRRIALSNPLLNFEKLLFVKRVPTSYSHLVMQYFGWRARPGGGIFVLEQPGHSLKARDILNGKLSGGNVLAPCLSWDAKKIVFSYTKCTSDDPYYHIYEVNVDGTNLKQLTYGEYEDLMPAYLPDGGIVFSSTRRKGYARCFGGQFGNRWHVYTIHRMNADGSNIQTLSFHETNEWFPTVMPSGFILYSRWDYVDRHPVVHQNLWLMRPDGTNPVALYGNHTESPNCSFQTKPIPGSDKIVFTASAHHSITGGSIAILDPKVDVDGQMPIERITPEVCFPEAEGRPQTYYAAPWPLSEDYFLVAYSHKPLIFEPAPNDANALGIYLLDRFGNKELIYRDPKIGCTNPIPLVPRAMPPAIPMLAPKNANDTGELVLLNVYEGLWNIPKGTVKALRIIQILPKATPVADVPPVGLAGQEPARAVLGTVQVEDDGSAYFTVPARKPLLFQALDERGMAVQTMRSITYLQPGEISSCIGCHERRTTAPANHPVKALMRAPSKIVPGPDGCAPFSYTRLVQPVFDKYCIKCHGDKDPKGNIVLTGVPEGQFSRSYLSLMKGRIFYGNGTNKENAAKELVPRYGGWNSVHTTQPGGTYGARGSRLMKLLLNNHYDVKLDAESIERLAIWIDANSVFYGTYDVKEQAKQRRGMLIAMPRLQ